MKNSFLESKLFKSIMAKAYGLGASVVIVGALFKILHLAGADFMLMVGLLTEAAIFAISAFEPPHQEPDWTLVYPELAGLDPKEKKASGSNGSVTQQLDKMLADAKIGPELISSLGNGFKSLNDNVNGLKDISGAVVATDAYSKNVKQAADSLSSINGSYVKASNAMESLATAAEGSKEMAAQLEKMNKNLSALNGVYGNMLAAMNVRN